MCEEAHRYVPNEQNADGNSVGTILSRIAKEGRKYGISLGLITLDNLFNSRNTRRLCGGLLLCNGPQLRVLIEAALPLALLACAGGAFFLV